MGSFNDDGREKNGSRVESSGRVGVVSRDSTFDPRELEEASSASLINRCFVHVVFLGLKRRGDKLQSTSGDDGRGFGEFREKK